MEVYLYQIATVDLYGRYTFVSGFKDLAGEIPGGVVDIEALNKTVFEANTEEWEKTARWAADLLKLPVFQLTDQGSVLTQQHLLKLCRKRKVQIRQERNF